MRKNLVALMSSSSIIYTLGELRGHAFRLYPDGTIGKADEQEKEIINNILTREKR